MPYTSICCCGVPSEAIDCRKEQDRTQKLTHTQPERLQTIYRLMRLKGDAGAADGSLLWGRQTWPLLRLQAKARYVHTSDCPRLCDGSLAAHAAWSASVSASCQDVSKLMHRKLREFWGSCACAQCHIVQQHTSLSAVHDIRRPTAAFRVQLWSLARTLVLSASIVIYSSYCSLKSADHDN